jgi:molybdenum cofactor cytidylyltransferase
MSVAAVVLAAGMSTRMGRAKATLPLGADGGTFLSRILETIRAAGVQDIVVVAGHDPVPIVDAASREPDTRVVVNTEYASGQLSSVLTGLRVIDREPVDAMLLTLVDVPLVSVATVRAVLDRYAESRAPLVRAVNGDRHGHPVLIARALFPELAAADETLGIKPVVRRHASAAGDVHVDDEGAFLDIDTPDIYRRVVEGLLP